MAVVGPTAAGKSGVALEVSSRVGGTEIVSIDSMAVYRGMDIATATPTAAERAAVPHHLLDLLDPWEDCTLAFFQDAAMAAMATTVERGHVPILVGGSGLYHRAVIDRLDIPGQFPAIRARLELEAAEPGGTAALLATLGELDPLAVTRIEPGNVRRIVRALEVCLGSGRPFSSYGPGLAAYRSTDVVQIGVLPSLEVVHRAVEDRVGGWVDGGLLDEVASLRRAPLALSRTAAQAIGYREFLACIDGDCSVEEATMETIRRTRQLVRRQVAWFRRDPRVRWASSTQEAQDLLDAAIARVRASSEVRDCP